MATWRRPWRVSLGYDGHFRIKGHCQIILFRNKALLSIMFTVWLLSELLSQMRLFFSIMKALLFLTREILLKRALMQKGFVCYFYEYGTSLIRKLLAP